MTIAMVAMVVATVDPWTLLDITSADATRMYAAGLDEACMHSVRAKLIANGAPEAYLDGTVPLSIESWVQANRVYNATLRVFDTLSDRQAMAQCVRGQRQCSWILAPIRRICGRAPDESTFVNTIRRDTLAWWVMRGISAFLLPSAPAHRQLGLLDGDASRVPHASGVAGTGIQKLQERVAQLMTTFSVANGLPSAQLPGMGDKRLSPTDLSGFMDKMSSAHMPPFSGSAFGRRLGLWSSASVPTVVTRAADRRDIVRAIPTLHTESERQAAERALTAIERELADFVTSLYMELPPQKKMLVASSMNHDVDAMYELLAYLKTTQLIHGVRKRMDLTDREAMDAVAFASGDDAHFEAFANALVKRLPPSLGASERSAMVQVLRAIQPTLRACGVALLWLREQ